VQAFTAISFSPAECIKPGMAVARNSIEMGLLYLAPARMLLRLMWRVNQADGCNAVITLSPTNEG